MRRKTRKEVKEAVEKMKEECDYEYEKAKDKMRKQRTKLGKNVWKDWKR